MTVTPVLRQARAQTARLTPVTAEQIKAAAVDLFAVRGYRGTTMRHIAAALGIQAPGLYNHVDSKQEILAGIMVGVTTELLEEQRVPLASTPDVPATLPPEIVSHWRYHSR